MHCVDTHRDVLGVVLAGGKSSRMGRNKALIPFKGTRLVDHMSSLLLNAGVNNVVISGTVDGHYCVPDLIPHLGPIGGIYAIVQHYKTTMQRCLFVPVDMPLLTAELLSKLLCFDTKKNLVHFSNYPLPFILNQIAAADYFFSNTFRNHPNGCSIKSFIQSLVNNHLLISDDDNKYFANINTPHDLQMSLLS